MPWPGRTGSARRRDIELDSSARRSPDRCILAAATLGACDCCEKSDSGIRADAIHPYPSARRTRKVKKHYSMLLRGMLCISSCVRDRLTLAGYVETDGA